MFTTKRKLAEQALRIIEGGEIPSNNNWDIREIVLVVEQAVNLLVRAEVMDTIRIGATHIGGQYISTLKNIPVLHDKDLALDYVEVPCKFLDLPRDQGIFQVSPIKNQFMSFLPVPKSFRAIFGGTQLEALEGETGYWVEGTRLYFTKRLKDCDQVLLKLVIPSPELIGLDEPYPISAGMELQVVSKAVELYGQQVPEPDKTEEF